MVKWINIRILFWINLVKFNRFYISLSYQIEDFYAIAMNLKLIISENFGSFKDIFFMRYLMSIHLKAVLEWKSVYVNYSLDLNFCAYSSHSSELVLLIVR